MKKIVILVVFIVFILPGLLILGIRELPYQKQPSLDLAQKIYFKQKIEQSFTGNLNNLSSIGISLRNFNLMNKKDIFFTLYSENGNLERSVALNGAHIKDGNFVKINFPPISDSSGRNFIFSLTAPDANQDEALQIFLTKQKLSRVGYLKIEDIEVEEHISFVDFYKTGSYFETTLEVYKNWFSKFISDGPFSIFYTGTIIFLLGYLIRGKTIFSLLRSSEKL